MEGKIVVVWRHIMFNLLGLISCNLTEIPDFLQFQDELEVLFIRRNNIQGPFPEWMRNKSRSALGTTQQSHDFFQTGSAEYPGFLPWPRIRIFDIGSNMLEGSPPIPPPTTFLYDLSNNQLTGKIPQSICSVSSLYALDLSHNNLEGRIHPCLVNFSNSLFVLNLKGNNFSGTIPRTSTKESNLKMLDLSQNQLEGPLPRSLANCKIVEILDLRDNHLEDTFPLWLGTLSRLQVLVLRSNKLHGPIESSTEDLRFANLRILDLSCNKFTGNMPLDYLESWNLMKAVHLESLSYMQANFTFRLQNVDWICIYSYSITMTNKGVKTVYEKILQIFTAVDLSSNKFKGRIPDSIGNLKGLQALNLSNNGLTGSITPSLGNLTELESLDLSQNNLSGEIPQQVAQLRFLAFVNFSCNHLAGPIPQGEQFDTFQANSYEGNEALCGEPLSQKCGNQEESIPTPPLSIEGDDTSKFPNGVDWVIIFSGFGGGLVVGLLIGSHLTRIHHQWFIETFGRKQEKRRKKTRARRNM